MKELFIESSDNINISTPYERCISLGPESLSDAQLLAVILRTGTTGCDATELAESILKLGESNKGLTGLMNTDIKELMSIRGVGRVKAIQIQCICELSRRIAKQSAVKKLMFRDSKSVASYYMEDLRHLSCEHLMLVMLDNKCNLIKQKVLTVGTVNASLINPREIFINALKAGAVYVILLHNHPSGDPRPSGNDIEVTKKVYEVGELIGISLLDHIIIGDNSYISLKELEYI